jgi:hypothetical protein
MLSLTLSRLSIVDGRNEDALASSTSDSKIPGHTTTPVLKKSTYAQVLNMNSSRSFSGTPVSSGTPTSPRPWDDEKQRLPV